MPIQAKPATTRSLDEAERLFEAEIARGLSGNWHAKLRLIFELESACRQTVPGYVEFIVPQ